MSSTKLVPRSHISSAVLLLVALVLEASAPARGAAQPSRAAGPDCGGAERWAEACGRAQALDLRVLHCPPGGLVLSARLGDATPVRVEVARGRQGAFRQVGDLGLSPIGEWPDWNDAPAEVRDGFERVCACVAEDPSLDVPAGVLVPTGGVPLLGPLARTPAPPPPPLLLLSGLLLAGAVFVRAARRALATTDAPRRRAIQQGAALLGLTVATFVGRALLVPWAFLHQNGQGPLWIDYALGAPTVYGPGYDEVLGLVARSAADPDRAVFLSHSLLLALGPALAFVLVRAVGARPALAFALALAVAVEPGLARLAGSESYFATMSSLLLLAGAVLAVGASSGRVKDGAFVLGVLAAGALAAQAARVHPLGAVGAATLPLVVLAGPGGPRARLRATAVATVGVGLIAVTGFALAFGDLTGGELGETWVPTFLGGLDATHVARGAGARLGAALVLVLLSRRRADALGRGVALAAVVTCVSVTDLLGAVPPIIHFGHAALFAAPVLALGGAMLADVTRLGPLPRAERTVPAVVALAALALAHERAAALTEHTTDMAELQQLLAWRDAIPSDARVAYVASAGSRTLRLPMHGAFAAGTPEGVQLRAEDPPLDLASLREPVFYYRSSLCESEEARPLCEDLERRFPLHVVETAELPARPSMGGLGYPRATVPVALFRLEASR